MKGVFENEGISYIFLLPRMLLGQRRLNKYKRNDVIWQSVKYLHVLM